MLQCKECGLLFLSEFPKNCNELYESGGMLQRVYDALTDNYLSIGMEKWREITRRDDERRIRELASLYQEKHVLEFGCGNGAFMKGIQNSCKSVTGVELEKNAIEYLNREGILTVNSLEKLHSKYEIIFLFHVLEHLTNPIDQLVELGKYLAPGGGIYIETPNANDALAVKYECEAFRNFTYWSEHVMLYNEISLKRLLNMSGFKEEKIHYYAKFGFVNEGESVSDHGGAKWYQMRVVF